MIILKIALIRSDAIAYSGLKYGLGLVVQKKKPLDFSRGFWCTTRHIVNTLYRTHTLQFLA